MTTALGHFTGWLRQHTYPTTIPWYSWLWAAILLILLAWADQALNAISLYLVPPFAASLSILLYLPQQPVAQPLPVIAGSTLSALVGTLVALFVHGPFPAAITGIVLLWALPRVGLYHPPAIALSLYPLLLHPGIWFPFAVVLPFTVVAVLSHIWFSRHLSHWPRYPREAVS